VMGLYQELKPKLDTPKKITDIPTSFDGYAAIFIPGGKRVCVCIYTYLYVCVYMIAYSIHTHTYTQGMAQCWISQSTRIWASCSGRRTRLLCRLGTCVCVCIHECECVCVCMYIYMSVYACECVTYACDCIFYIYTHTLHSTPHTHSTLCHGPGVLLAAAVGAENEPFAYDDYKITVFPDSIDKFTPYLG
jgi:hypothetical protein